MANTTRQTAIFGIEDWKRIYQTYQEADFQSYDFETIRKSFVDYLRTFYPETFNDFVESSEFIALLDLIAFMGQSLAFRSELNARENFLETADRRESVVKLAELVAYSPKRNETASGFLKLFSISTTENITDYNGNNLRDVAVSWDDSTNPDWYEQMVTILNAMLVDSQRVGRPGNKKTILGVETSQYSVNTVPGSLPTRAFTSKVNNVSMNFEAVSSDITTGRVIEAAPRLSAVFNLLYRNDQLGFASPNTGFFILFKQGSLQARDYNLTDRIANRNLDVEVPGVNNSDVWVFSADQNNEYSNQWTAVDSLVSPPDVQRNKNKWYYSITSGANDKVTINFGDGVFAEIPVGLLRVFCRSSNGLQYVITPNEMAAITITLPYVSRRNRVETATLTVGLTTAVSNAKVRETIEEIKARAPARYYSQHRMVNGEDYSNFPFTQYGSILKSKAVNRSTIGASRYLDLVDVTGKYSSTNVFGSDGVLYEEDELNNFSFSWNDLNDIADVIINRLEPLLASRAVSHFYYKERNYERPAFSTPYRWVQKTVQLNETTGYFINASDTPQVVGPLTSDNRRYLVPAALIKFVPPSGYFFNESNRLVFGEPGANQKAKYHIWATITSLKTDGANGGVGALEDGSGPISLNVFVPSNAILDKVIPVFSTDLPVGLEQDITREISLNLNFALGYNPYRREWFLIKGTALDQANQEAVAAGLPADQFQPATMADPYNPRSWLVRFETDTQTYTVTTRWLAYYFASLAETRFFYDGTQQVYDPKTGTVVNDYIRLLKTNTLPASLKPLDSDVILDIVGQPPEVDGHINDYRVSISFTDLNLDGIADDPDFFDYLVDDSSYVFFRVTRTSDNLEEVMPLAANSINVDYATETDLSVAIYSYDIGTTFYATAEHKIFVIELDASGQRMLSQRVIKGTEQPGQVPEFIISRGRQGLQYHYRHNSPTSRRIDPGSTNIIDLYLVVNSYYTEYQRYLRDTTNTIVEPIAPTVNELEVAYKDLNKYKMVSDNIVFNSVRFKPLFGDKAELGLRAAIKVVRNSKVNASDSEIKSKVIRAINEFFTIDKWDFGDTFYFSELAAFLHKELGELISSAVIVPRNPLQKFGALFEVKSRPNEIFVSAATVNDIEVIEAITTGNIRSE